MDPIGGASDRDATGRPESDKPFDDKLFDIATSLQAAHAHLEDGELAEAESLLRKILLVNPTDVQAIFELASIQVTRGQLNDAIDLFDAVPVDDGQMAVRAAGQAAELCVKQERFADALERYRKVLAIFPASPLAHRQIAFILNRQGRRHEAARHVRVLCKLGNVRQDELHSLMVLSDAIYDDPNEKASHQSDGVRHYPIGPSGLARKLFSEKRYVEAADLLSESVNSPDTPVAVQALYGRCLAEAQDDERFVVWLGQVDESIRNTSEFWSAIGTWMLNQKRFDESVRAFLEAVVRDPTDAYSYRRLIQAFTALDRPDDAKRWDDRHQLLRTTTLASNEIGKLVEPDLDQYKTVIEGLEGLDRPLEALMWRAIEQHHRSQPQTDLKQFNEQRAMLVSSNTAFPNTQQRLCGLELSKFPLVELANIAPASGVYKARLTVNSVEPPSFENVASSIGLDHTYRLAAEPLDAGFAIYQAIGGGVAVLDFDLDGTCDFYFAQGNSDPPTLSGGKSNQLFQNRSGNLSDVTSVSGASDVRYSIGVTAGDWNQDGFPDIVVANLGINTLLINNGDGTFRAQATDSNDDVTRVSTSVAMGDVTGDNLPDIFEGVYIHDKGFDAKPTIKPDGQVEFVSPLDYQPGMDRIFINDPTGRLIVKDVSESPDDRRTGLGAVIADFDSDVGNELYVGNDVRPNQLWKWNSAGQWTDTAPLTGTALGYDGTRTASMGIAMGDFDRSGTLDFHITNFEAAPSRLYMNHLGTFQDRALAFRLAEDSHKLVGFGTQAIDYSNDGFPDLAVTNGHVENTNVPESPFEQPPQLFANFGNRFELMKVEDPSGYFETLHAGRALARLDYNQDGKSDFVVTHMEAPSALLINRTATKNHWLDLAVVGVDCERDAIGTKIELKSGDQTWTNWVIAGDGYLCRNEPVVSFGLGAVETVDTMSVTWADGDVQTFSNVRVDQRLLLVQHDPTPFALVFGAARD
ncbi:FG-GAP-like repeat-containing protein [Planctomycetes bacterium CA13]